MRKIFLLIQLVLVTFLFIGCGENCNNSNKESIPCKCNFEDNNITLTDLSKRVFTNQTIVLAMYDSKDDTYINDITIQAEFNDVIKNVSPLILNYLSEKGFSLSNYRIIRSRVNDNFIYYLEALDRTIDDKYMFVFAYISDTDSLYKMNIIDIVFYESFKIPYKNLSTKTYVSLLNGDYYYKNLEYYDVNDNYIEIRLIEISARALIDIYYKVMVDDQMYSINIDSILTHTLLSSIKIIFESEGVNFLKSYINEDYARIYEKHYIKSDQYYTFYPYVRDEFAGEVIVNGVKINDLSSIDIYTGDVVIIIGLVFTSDNKSERDKYAEEHPSL